MAVLDNIRGPRKRPVTTPTKDWPELFERHLPHVDPSILKLAREFCQQERKAVRDMAGWIWSGGWGAPIQPLRPRTVEDAIEVAITAMWENAHPELEVFRRVIQ